MYDPNRHQRRSIRLPGYDYDQSGAYFVTLCTHDHRCLFGRIEGETMRLNRVGEIAEECWRTIPVHFADVELDVFAVMPNHVHGIIIIGEAEEPSVGATHASPVRIPHASSVQEGPGGTAGPAGMPQGPKRRSVGAIIGSYKSAASREIHETGNAPAGAVWQRNYFEHIIRNDVALNRIRQYTLDNPVRWAYDRYNPQAIRPETDDSWRE